MRCAPAARRRPRRRTPHAAPSHECVYARACTAAQLPLRSSPPGLTPRVAPPSLCCSTHPPPLPGNQHSYWPVVRHLELSLQRFYIVNAIQNDRLDKVPDSQHAARTRLRRARMQCAHRLRLAQQFQRS